MDPRIADFIAKNQGKYTREALRQQLIDAGYEPDAIDATWAALDTPDPDEASVAGEGFWPRFFLFLVGLNVAVFLLVALSTGMFEALTTGGGALAGVFAVVLGIGALLAWGIVAMVGPAKLGRTTAIVIGGVIPLVFALLIGGSCFALASAIGPPPPPPVSGEMELQIDAPFTLDASGAATCQPTRDAIGYSVYAEGLGQLEGRPLYVSVGAFENQPGELTTTVSISGLAETDANPLDWFNTTATRLETDVAADGLSGSVIFENLTPGGPDQPLPSAADEGALTGSVSWSCEETAP